MSYTKNNAQATERSLAATYELPVIQQGESLLISASLLHRKLKVSTKFSMWFQRRVEKYAFEKEVDYFPNLGSKKQGRGNFLTDYLLTLDTAKEMAMLEENEIGRQIRRYFIAKEKELRAISHLPKEQQFLKGVSTQKVNGQKMYAYKQVRERAGYSTKSSSATHKLRYPNHFVLMGTVLYVTQEFAHHLYHQRQVFNNRAALKAMQPVLPFNFGESLTPTLSKGEGVRKGGSHA